MNVTTAKQSTPRILIVDDHSQNRLLIKLNLETLDVIIDEASSGEECLDYLKKQDYLKRRS